MIYLFLGVLLVVGGSIAKIYFKKSAFERRNINGVEEYGSFWNMVAFKASETVSGLAIVLGIILFGVGYVQSQLG